jgi:uncharacterized protein YihD (DUF1040 family)
LIVDFLRATAQELGFEEELARAIDEVDGGVIR